MIAGPARSGRTTALLVVAEVLSRLYPDIRLVGDGDAALGAARLRRAEPR